ncbi:MAG: 4-alpha-glucanotransferase [Spirochaetaceae bacterium]|jgi:4-alpha-glucanotransferase|nr:4-alpha-glucanotransferase [Spirochaetaceae bacterium]
MEFEMDNTRKSGILLHPTSLPGTPGIGTIGKEAYRFVDWLSSAKQSLWQILPLGPTGYGDSPYASFSTFAGNPLIVDIDMLVESGYLSGEQALPPEFIRNEGYVDFGAVVFWKIPLLKLAASQFLDSAKKEDRTRYEAFKNDNAGWLDNYSIFMSIKEYYDEEARKADVQGAMWNNYWPRELAIRDPKAVSDWHSLHVREAEVHKVIQFFFFTQWRALKKYANEQGVSIIGDIPIFVAPDSADVWANQRLFQLDENGAPEVVAGVPPDYFSATGQLWGNPLYDWDEMQKDKYRWWIDRIKGTLGMVDYIRIDHFRGFEAYWAIPFGEETAINGEWIPGPGSALFEAIREELGQGFILAEDLGLITEGVRKLRDDFGLPGMKVLQFAFDVNEAGKDGFVNAFLPHMYDRNCVVYTGTHDNETMQGWIDAASPEEKELVTRYLGGNVSETLLTHELIRLAMASVADYAVFPLQDIFAVGSEGRMNAPSTTGGINWQWRMSEKHFDEKAAQGLKEMSRLYARNMGWKGAAKWEGRFAVSSIQKAIRL